MNNNKLEILVTAKDAASNVIQGVGKSFTQLSDTAVTGSKMMLGATLAVGAGVVAFGKLSVDAYNGAAEASAKLSTNILNVKGNTMAQVDALEQLASKMQGYGVIEDDAIKAGMSQLATFNLQSSTIGTLTPKIADMVAQMKGHNATAEDMVGVNNLVGKVMTGNVGALSRYGVTLNDTQAAMIANGTEAQRAATLVEVLGQNYGEVNKNLRNTPQGMFTGIKNDLGDLQEGVGQLIVTAMMPLAKVFSDWMVTVNDAGGFVQYFTDLINNNKDTVIRLVGALVAMLIPAIVSLAISAAPVLLTMAALAAVGALLAPVINNLAERFGGWGAIFGRVKGWIDTGVTGFKALVAAFNGEGVTSDGFIGQMEKAGVILRQVWEGLKATGVAVWGAIQQAIEFLRPSFEMLWKTISEQLIPALKAMWDFISPFIIPTLQVLGAILGVVIVAAIWLVVNVINVIVAVISAWIQFMIGLYKAIFNVIVAAIEFGMAVGKAFADAWNWIVAVWNGIGAWFGQKWGELTAIFGNVGGWFRDRFTEAVNGIKGVFGGIGAFFQGVWNGLVGIFGTIGTNIANAIGGSIKSVLNTVLTIAENGVNGFIDLLNGAIDLINKIPGVGIGKIGRLSFPRFAKGTHNFGGGMALVGENGPELVNMPRGADVVGNHQLSRLGGMGGNITNQFYGDMNFDSKEVVDYFFDRLNRQGELTDLGVAQ